MKRTITLIFAFSLLLPAVAFAGGVIHNSNVSPEYISSFTRNASIDGADLVHYNAAGAVWMPRGLYLSVGNQFIAKEYSHTYEGTTYKDNEPVFLFPDLFAIYNMEKWAVFGSFTVPAGGGSIKYNDGVYHPLIIPDKAEGFTAHFETAIGGAYRINNMFSVALIGRFIYGIGDVNSEALGMTVKKYDTETKGFGGTVSFNARPMDQMLISLRIESPIQLTWKIHNYEGILAEPTDRREDLPPVIGLGVSYQLNPKMRTELNFNYYINKMAKWEKQDDGIHGDDPEFQKKFDNGFEVSGMFEMRVIPRLKLRIGAMYTVSGSNKHTHDYLRPPLDAFSVGVGGTYAVHPMAKITLGLSKSWYFEDDIVSDDGSVTLTGNKDTIVAALGLEMHF